MNPRLGLVFFPAFDWAISASHPEREERLLYTRDQLLEEGLFDIPGITEYRPAFATHAQLERAHFCLPSAAAVSTDSHLASAGGAIRAAQLVLEGREQRAFALVPLLDVAPDILIDGISAADWLSRLKFEKDGQRISQ